MSEYIPKEFKIEKDSQTVSYHKVDRLINKETGEHFLLTSRDFREINHLFSNLPSRVISKLKEKKGEEESIRILDLGGGIEAKSAGDIAEKYGGEQDERIQVFSLDITAKKKDQKGLHQVVGDVLQLPIKDDSIDMAYSYMSISLLEESNPETLGKALEEAARVLKPGGLLFLDKTYTERLGRNLDINALTKFGEKLGVTFYSKELGLFLKPLERILNKLNQKYPDWKFIIMVKEPVDQELIKSLKLKEKDRLT